MIPKETDIVQFETDVGVSPFADWFDDLDTRAATKVRTALARMEAGNLGDAKSVGDGVLERRIDWGPGYRIYFGRDGNRLIVLLAGGTKSGQRRDIRRAQSYWMDYRRRKKER